ncbi:MAG: YqaA family protein [Halothiobacillaceae bacterium]
MRLFGPLYELVLGWSAHRRAPWYLGGLSFAESSFFPIPPDVMLAPMTLARPKAWWRLALLTTVASVLGGLFGYLIGFLAIDVIEPSLRDWGYGEAFDLSQQWFAQWGFAAVLVAGFSPIPYKIFTIAAGALTMNPLLFVLASMIGRGGRFFLVAGLIGLAGPKLEPLLRRYVEWLGWLTVVALVILVWLFKG